jgi:hypothetical protein
LVAGPLHATARDGSGRAAHRAALASPNASELINILAAAAAAR